MPQSRSRNGKSYTDNAFNQELADTFIQRQKEADEFYQSLTPNLEEDVRNVQRQAFAGLLWTKQFYTMFALGCEAIQQNQYRRRSL